MADALRTSTVVEIIRPIKSGTTEPFLCRLDDDRLYAIKGRGANAHGLIAEVYAACLGRALGLEIPNFALADVPADLVDIYPDPALRQSIGAGMGFASFWQQPAEDVTVPLLEAFDPQLLARVYVFDHWIRNGDRSLTEHGGNVNLLVRLRDRALIVIDHNLAFWPAYQHDELELHACRKAWLHASRSMLFKDELRAEMEGAMKRIEGLDALLPDAWIEQEPHFAAAAGETLARMHGDAFWDELG